MDKIMFSLLLLLSILHGIQNRTTTKEFDRESVSTVFFRLFNNSLRIYNGDAVERIVLEHDANEKSSWATDAIEYSELFSPNPLFQKQPDNGLLYFAAEHYTFKFELETVPVNYRFRVETSSKLILYGSIFAFDWSESSGFRNVSLIDREMNIKGVLRIDYLISRPLRLSKEWSGSPEYPNITQFQWAGHRGTGPGLRNDVQPKLYENTIDAYNYVCKKGAQMIELDVQLSRDLVPIIYHDFSRKFVAQAGNNASVSCVADVKDYTVQEHQHMILPGLEKFKVFETFQSVLEKLDDKCGIIVEIKYPQQYDNLAMEAELPVDINLYVDRILQVLLRYAHKRPIAISSFSADICTLIQLKQDRYDVYFLTSGNLESFPVRPYDPYYDLRTRTVQANIAFAKSFNFAGLSLFSDHLYMVNMDDIQNIRRFGLQLAVWGASVDSKHKADELLRKGVTILILDKVDHFVPDKPTLDA